jgi:hypothetical protein
VLEDRHARRPLGGEIDTGYGVGTRVLEDRYAEKPLGGGVDAGYGIGNRILEDGIGEATQAPHREFESAYFLADQPVGAVAVVNHDPVADEKRRRLHREEVDRAFEILRESGRKRFASLREAFRSMDKSRNGFVNLGDFAAALLVYGIGLSPELVEVLRLRFHRGGSGRICFADYCAAFD